MGLRAGGPRDPPGPAVRRRRQGGERGEALQLGHRVVTHFSQYDYDQPSDLDLPVAIGEGHTPFPEDYRTKEQVERDTGENEREAAELRHSMGWQDAPKP